MEFLPLSCVLDRDMSARVMDSISMVKKKRKISPNWEGSTELFFVLSS